jgi:hypothetical protein
MGVVLLLVFNAILTLCYVFMCCSWTKGHVLPSMLSTCATIWAHSAGQSVKNNVMSQMNS